MTDSFWNLLSKSNNTEESVLLNAGGQEGDFPMRKIVHVQTALTAAHTFLETGALDSKLRWEQQV
jgi:hypothetical protein